MYRPPRGDRTKERDNSRSGMEAGDDSRRSRFPDSQQLFVGNLPHTISQKELKQFFESMLSRLYNVQFVFRKKILSTYQILHGFCIFSCSQGYYKVRTNSIISCLISDFGTVLEVRINRKKSKDKCATLNWEKGLGTCHHVGCPTNGEPFQLHEFEKNILNLDGVNVEKVNSQYRTNSGNLDITRR